MCARACGYGYGYGCGCGCGCVSLEELCIPILPTIYLVSAVTAEAKARGAVLTGERANGAGGGSTSTSTMAASSALVHMAHAFVWCHPLCGPPLHSLGIADAASSLALLPMLINTLIFYGCSRD